MCNMRLMSFRKHAKLINLVYPADYSLDVVAKDCEYSRLLFYCKSKPVKLTKVVNYLYCRVINDVYQEKIGHIKITLNIYNSIMNECPKYISTYALGGLKIIYAVLESRYRLLYDLAILTFDEFIRRYQEDLVFDLKIAQETNRVVTRMTTILSLARDCSDACYKSYSISGFSVLRKALNFYPSMIYLGDTSGMYQIFKTLMNSILVPLSTSEQENLLEKFEEIFREKLKYYKDMENNGGAEGFCMNYISRDNPKYEELMTILCLNDSVNCSKSINDKTNLIFRYFQKEKIVNSPDIFDLVLHIVQRFIFPSYVKFYVIKIINQLGDKLTQQNVSMNYNASKMLLNLKKSTAGLTKSMELEILLALFKKLFQTCAILNDSEISSKTFKKNVDALHASIKDNISLITSSILKSTGSKNFHIYMFKAIFKDVIDILSSEPLNLEDPKNGFTEISGSLLAIAVEFLDVIINTMACIADRPEDEYVGECLLNEDCPSEKLIVCLFLMVFSITPLLLKENERLRKKVFAAMHLLLKNISEIVKTSTFFDNDLAPFVELLCGYIYKHYTLYGGRICDSIIFGCLLKDMRELVCSTKTREILIGFLLLVADCEVKCDEYSYEFSKKLLLSAIVSTIREVNIPALKKVIYDISLDPELKDDIVEIDFLQAMPWKADYFDTIRDNVKLNYDNQISYSSNKGIKIIKLRDNSFINFKELELLSTKRLDPKQIDESIARLYEEVRLRCTSSVIEDQDDIYINIDGTITIRNGRNTQRKSSNVSQKTSYQNYIQKNSTSSRLNLQPLYNTTGTIKLTIDDGNNSKQKNEYQLSPNNLWKVFDNMSISTRSDTSKNRIRQTRKKENFSIQNFINSIESKHCVNEDQLNYLEDQSLSYNFNMPILGIFN